MKIGILTFVNTSNYGASLQAYALQQVIKSYGHECDIIRYENESISSGHDPKAVFRRRGIKKIVAPIVYYVYKKRIEKFRAFENMYCTFSAPCDENTISEVTGKYDRIVVGSDQVWNTELTKGDKTFFLDFVKDSEKKYSYAGSVGKDYLDESDAVFIQYLKDFKVLSCREKETAERLSLDLSRKDISCDEDPTFLIRYKWRDFVNSPLIRGKYIFMYFIPEDGSLIDKIREFARKENCRLVLLKKGAGARKGIKVVNIASPIDFINYISYARYVITGSFHALCFSLMLEKSVFATSSIEKNRSGRLVQLLEKLELEDRILDASAGQLNTSLIDYSGVNMKLNEMHEESLKTIERIVK